MPLVDCSFHAVGKGDSEEHDVEHWTLVGQKMTAEEHLAEDAKKVRFVLKVTRCEFQL